RRTVERHVLSPRGDRRTRRPAVDAGRTDAHVEHAVEALVPRRDGTVVALVLVGAEHHADVFRRRCHASIMHRPTDTNWRKSDTNDECPRRSARAFARGSPDRGSNRRYRLARSIMREVEQHLSKHVGPEADALVFTASQGGPLFRA